MTVSPLGVGDPVIEEEGASRWEPVAPENRDSVLFFNVRLFPQMATTTRGKKDPRQMRRLT